MCCFCIYGVRDLMRSYNNRKKGKRRILFTACSAGLFLSISTVVKLFSTPNYLSGERNTSHLPSVYS